MEIPIIFFLLFLSGILVMSKTAILTASGSRLREWADQGDASAKKALNLAANPHDFQTALQTATILIRVVACILAGAIVSSWLAGMVSNAIPILAPYSLPIAFAAVTISFGYFCIVIGELVPRAVARSNPERIACNSAAPVEMLIQVTAPLTYLIAGSEAAITKALRLEQPKARHITEREIEELLEGGAQAGVLRAYEQQMLVGVLKLDELKISSVMTPRPDLAWLDVTATDAVILRKVEENHHTRFIVADGNLDKVLGIVNARDVFLQWQRTGTVNLRDCLFSALIVPESKVALEVLEDFKQSKIHIAFVMDEYGVLRGLVTMSDVLEAIVGNLLESGDKDNWEVVQRDDGSWLFDAVTPVVDFKRITQIPHLPGEQEEIYNTVGGFIIHCLEHIPAISENFEFAGLRFEVLEMDGHRIDKVLVSPHAK